MRILESRKKKSILGGVAGRREKREIEEGKEKEGEGRKEDRKGKRSEEKGEVGEILEKEVTVTIKVL